jgi:hypothetical protein
LTCTIIVTFERRPAQQLKHNAPTQPRVLAATREDFQNATPPVNIPQDVTCRPTREILKTVLIRHGLRFALRRDPSLLINPGIRTIPPLIRTIPPLLINDPDPMRSRIAQDDTPVIT